jgi:hypothetical protein
MNGSRHKINIATTQFVEDLDKVIAVNTKELRQKYIGFERIQSMHISTNLNDRYRIPPALIEELFDCMVF